MCWTQTVYCTSKVVNDIADTFDVRVSFQTYRTHDAGANDFLLPGLAQGSSATSFTIRYSPNLNEDVEIKDITSTTSRYPSKVIMAHTLGRGAILPPNPNIEEAKTYTTYIGGKNVSQAFNLPGYLDVGENTVFRSDAGTATIVKNIDQNSRILTKKAQTCAMC